MDSVPNDVLQNLEQSSNIAKMKKIFQFVLLILWPLLETKMFIVDCDPISLEKCTFWCKKGIETFNFFELIPK